MARRVIQDAAASLSFRHLKLFESIGRLKSVRRASEECNLSQPAVTQALAKLEQHIGFALVERRASGSYLNEFGEVFHGRVTRFFDQLEAALCDLNVPGGAEGTRLASKRLSRSQVRTLLAVVEAGSFARAAAVLGLSQASLQRAARDLEGNLRKTLYFRTADGVVVTAAGVELGRRIKLALQEIEWGVRELAAARGGAGSQIVIGAMPFGGSVALAAVLEDFVQAHPRADVRIVSEGATEMQRRLRAGEVDLAIGLLPEAAPGDLVSEAFARTPYSVVVRRGHPLLQKGRLSTADLMGYDWVVGACGSSRRACFDRLFAGRASPQAPIATSSLPVIRHLLARSDRLTLMTSYELMHEDTGLVAAPFGPILPAPSIGVTMRANWLPTRLHTDFVEIVRRHMATAPVEPVLLMAV